MNMQHVHHKHHIQHPATVDQDVYPHLQSLKVYTYTIPANQSVIIPAQNNHFFILAATGNVGIWGDTFGQFDGLTQGQGMNNCPFNKLILSDQSGASNTVKLLIAPGEFTNQILQSLVSIQSSQILQLIRPEQSTGHYQSNSAIVAATPIQIIAPAANINGAVILSANTFSSGTNLPGVTLIAKATAPSTVIDGEVFMYANANMVSGTTYYEESQLPKEEFLAAGLGLYFISGANSSFSNLSVRYKLL
jgi:hypothetical protein